MAVKLNVEMLKGDRRRSEYGPWQDWMDTATKLATRFYNDAGEDDPFAYGEAASVGFLATAAARAGYLALPEFAVTKTSQIDGRRKSRGRSDLWLQTSAKHDWWFEFKQHFILRGSDRDLERKWDAAEKCAKQIRMNGVAVAGLVVSFAGLKERRWDNLEAARASLARFQKGRQFAWRIAGEDEEPETYIFLGVTS